MENVTPHLCYLCFFICPGISFPQQNAVFCDRCLARVAGLSYVDGVNFAGCLARRFFRSSSCALDSGVSCDSIPDSAIHQEILNTITTNIEH